MNESLVLNIYIAHMNSMYCAVREGAVEREKVQWREREKVQWREREKVQWRERERERHKFAIAGSHIYIV